MKKFISLLLTVVFITSLAVIAPLKTEANTVFYSPKIVAISSDVFQYGGARKITMSVLNYQLFDTSCKITILNSKNKIVKSFSKASSSYGDIAYYSWDGKDSKKKYVSDGIYKFRFQQGFLFLNNSYISFIVKKTPNKSEKIKSKLGTMNMDGYTLKIPSDWQVGASMTSYSEAYYFIRSPKLKGVGKRAIMSFKYYDYSGTGMSDDFIKQETFKTMDQFALSQSGGKIVGTGSSKIGPLSASKKVYEYKATSKNNLLVPGEMSFTASVKNYLALKSSVLYFVEVGQAKGSSALNSKIQGIMDSIKITSTTSGPMFGPVKFSGVVKAGDVRFTIPAGMFSETQRNSSYLYVGNPVNRTFGCSASVYSTATYDEDYGDSYSVDSEVSDILADLKDVSGPMVTPSVSNVVIDELPAVKIKINIVDDALKTILVDEYYVFRLYSRIYTVNFYISLEDEDYSKAKADEFLLLKDAFFASLILAPEGAPTAVPTATPVPTPVATATPAVTATPTATPVATPTATPASTSSPSPG